MKEESVKQQQVLEAQKEVVVDQNLPEWKKNLLATKKSWENQDKHSPVQTQMKQLGKQVSIFYIFFYIFSMKHMNHLSFSI